MIVRRVRTPRKRGAGLGQARASGQCPDLTRVESASNSKMKGPIVGRRRGLRFGFPPGLGRAPVGRGPGLRRGGASQFPAGCYGVRAR
jgi:hypothetical protein